MTTMNKLLVGFAAGAILGILYAPAKGSKTRRKIADVGDGIKNKWNSATDCIADGIDRFRNGVDDAADRTIEKIESTQFTGSEHPAL